MDGSYQRVVKRIQRLSDEQHRLYLAAANCRLSNARRRRLAEIKAELQTLWLSRKHERPRFHDPLNALVGQSIATIGQK